MNKAKVELTIDQAAVVRKEVKTITGAMVYLLEKIEEDGLDEEMRKALIGSSEFSLGESKSVFRLRWL